MTCGTDVLSVDSTQFRLQWTPPPSGAGDPTPPDPDSVALLQRAIARYQSLLFPASLPSTLFRASIFENRQQPANITQPPPLAYAGYSTDGTSGAQVLPITISDAQSLSLPPAQSWQVGVDESYTLVLSAYAEESELTANTVRRISSHRPMF